MHAYPLTEQSLSRYGALSLRPLNMADANNLAEFQRLQPSLLHDTSLDKRTDIKTKQALIDPIVAEDNYLTSVLQLRNKKRGVGFTGNDEPSSEKIPAALGIALFTVRRVSR